MTIQIIVSYYGNKEDHSNQDTLMHTHICPIYLYDWTLNDLVYCHNNTHLTEQSFSVAGFPPCKSNYLLFKGKQKVAKTKTSTKATNVIEDPVLAFTRKL